MSLEQFRGSLQTCQMKAASHQRQLEKMGVGSQVEQMLDLMDEACNLVAFGHRPVLAFSGAFSTGKSALCEQTTGVQLPSGEKPTSRSFAVIEPMNGLDKCVYSLVYSSSSDVRQLLELMVKELPSTFRNSLTELFHQQPRVKQLAAEMIETIGKLLSPDLDPEVCQKLANTAFICRGIAENHHESLSRRTVPLNGSGALSAAEQAECHLSWGVDQELSALAYEPGTPTSHAELMEELNEWFVEQSRLEPFQNRADFQDVKARYDVSLELGCLEFVLIQAPATSEFSANIVIVDCPGGGGTHNDDIMLAKCLRSTTAGVLFDLLVKPGSKETKKITGRLKKSKSFSAAAFTYGDYPLDGHEGHLQALGREDPAAATMAAREIAKHYASLTSANNRKEDVWNWLNSPVDQATGQCDADRVLLLCNIFDDDSDKGRNAKERCRQLVHLARFLKDEHVLKHLPPSLEEVVRKYHCQQSLPGIPLPDLDPLTERMTARLFALLVALGDDGGGKAGVPTARATGSRAGPADCPAAGNRRRILRTVHRTAGHTGRTRCAAAVGGRPAVDHRPES